MGQKNRRQSPKALRKRYKKRQRTEGRKRARQSLGNDNSKKIKKYLILGLGILALLALALFGYKYYKDKQQPIEEEETAIVTSGELQIDVKLLTVNPYSRPGLESNPITGIVMHYTANPASSAQDNRDYFEGLKDSHTTQVSSHFIIGLNGEIIQCIPTWEIAYASNNRNIDTISIEVCHPDETGRFTEETYASMVQLTSWLCKKYELTPEQIMRHYDITGKICPKYFVDDEGAWQKFLEDVQVAMDKA